MLADKNTRTILLIEGQPEADSSLAHQLLKAGFVVQSFVSGREAVSWSQDHPLDLVVLDASSMRSNGARICKRLRGILPDTPIIHCRGEGDPEMPQGLADIYLEQPFTGRKLLNRVRDLLPADPAQEEIVFFGDLTYYRGKRSVEVADRGEHQLTPKLANLLEEFLLRPGQVITRKELMENVWHTTYVGDTRTLDVHIRWVRECIEHDPSNPELLVTKRGEGFFLAIPENA
ncbi:MAG: response regulator transcription factor [Candidatus Promineifilaceae bacterium]|jgi:two-component system phosphate regulon response regulator PhoB